MSTRQERAHQAWITKDSFHKKAFALKHLEKLKEEYGHGISTLGLVYNATGDDLTYLTYKDWHGHTYCCNYPQTIANGQWGGFFHVKGAFVPYGSSGAVVYGGQNNDNHPCAWMVSWSNPLDKRDDTNKCYTEIRDANHYNNDDIWGLIRNLMVASESHDTWNGCYSTVEIPQGDSVVLETIFTLEGADRRG